jgi:hypothetical protein
MKVDVLFCLPKQRMTASLSDGILKDRREKSWMDS